MLPRFMPLADGHVRAARGADRKHLDQLFPGMEIVDCGVFRVTRDADFTVSDEADDLLQAVEDELRRRRFGEVVRVEVQSGMSREMREQLERALEAEERGRVRRSTACSTSTTCGAREDARLQRAARPAVDAGHPAAAAARRGRAADVMAAMREGDILLHHPYDSFSTSVERFVEQAVADPDVLAIKQTVYRTSDDSPLVPALIRAAERGKQAVCLVELKARFDERANIHVGARAGGGRRARRLRPAVAQDAREVHPDRAPRGRRRAQLRARRHRQLPPEDGAPVHRLRAVHVRRADRRRRRRHVQLPHRLRAPAALPPGAGGAGPPARRRSSPRSSARSRRTARASRAHRA